MSTELIGNCGYTVGERGYFERINKAFGLSEVINFSVGYDYYNGIKNFCDKLSSIISEVYSDVRNNAKIMSFLDERDREETINIVEGLNEVCKMWARSCSDADRAKSILSLSASETRLKSGYKKNEIEKTARKVIRGSYSGVSSSEKIRLLEKAISSSVIRAANGNAEKLAYLLDIEQGKGDNFLFDVLFKCEYDANPRRYTGRNGKEICSRSYNSNILSEAFGNSTISSNSYGYSKKFSEILGKRFERVCKEMEDDIDKGIRNRDYILDSNGERMKTAIAQIEKVGTSCYGLRGKVDVLMWFVGGNQRDVLQLQRNLNKLGFRGSGSLLKEDGVFGRRTCSALEQFIEYFTRASFKSLTWSTIWIDPLQTDLTGIRQDYKITKNGEKYLQLLFREESKPVLRLDRHPYGKNRDFPHLNVGTLDSFTKRQIINAGKWDHFGISNKAYDALKSFDQTAKVIKVSGKTLLITGIIADTISLGKAIESDLKDADRKLGKTTSIEIIRIIGSWTGSAIGAKYGAMLGASVGTAALPGLGTAAGGIAGGLIGATVLGIIGSYSGDLAEYVIDISELE